jgi:oligopeptide transport system substrate-binding protein
MAVDRQAIVTKVLRGGEAAAHALTPSGVAGYTPRAQVPTDFEAARQLLAAAGYPGGKGLPAIELLYNNNESHRLIAEATQEMWRRELGIDVRLVNQELKVTFAARRAGDFQVLRSNWIADYLIRQRSSRFSGATAATTTRGGPTKHTTPRCLRPPARQIPPRGWSCFSGLKQSCSRKRRSSRFITTRTSSSKQPTVKGWHPTLLDLHPYKHVWLEN